jgi:hypothetical protein
MQETHIGGFIYNIRDKKKRLALNFNFISKMIFKWSNFETSVFFFFVDGSCGRHEESKTSHCKSAVIAFTLALQLKSDSKNLYV